MKGALKLFDQAAIPAARISAQASAVQTVRRGDAGQSGPFVGRRLILGLTPGKPGTRAV